MYLLEILYTLKVLILAPHQGLLGLLLRASAYCRPAVVGSSNFRSPTVASSQKLIFWL